MAFKDEIITAIQAVADSKGTNSAQENIGSNGKAWDPDPSDSTKMQSINIVIEGIATAVEARTIHRYPPFNGTLIKVISSFLSPNIIIVNDTHGVRIGDSFGVSGSLYNNGGKTVTAINGDAVTVSQDITTETSTDIEIIIGPPNSDLNIEESIDRTQASIFDKIPKNATTTKRGIIKQGTFISEFISPITPAETKLNEIIFRLKQAGFIKSSV